MGEFETVMQTRDEVEGLHNCRETTTMFTYSHANTPLGQSERAYYLSYFIKVSVIISSIITNYLHVICGVTAL